ncbi:MAG TPA: sigma-70 family RNA polymerase sigma factor [Polyangia bacterium]|nr:sigma-70 family RNA polymerase sigma factor [Polyangia bacterium]
MLDGDEIARLVRRAQKGDIRAFEELVSAHIPQVRRFAQAFVRDESDAADLAQDALVKVYRSIGSYRFQSAFSTWLYAIIRNVFLDGARSRAGKERALELPFDVRHIDSARPSPLDDMSRADAQIEREQERKRVWLALGEVQAEFRATLVLFDIEGLTYEEVAAIEGVPLGTVKSRLSRGREQLRRLLTTSTDLPRADAEDGVTAGPAENAGDGNIADGQVVSRKGNRSA